MFNIELKWMVDGREVSPNDFSNAIEAQVFEHIKGHVQERLNGVSCTEHHQRPSVQVSGQSLSKLQFQIYGCCEKLREAAAQALR